MNELLLPRTDAGVLVQVIVVAVVWLGLVVAVRGLGISSGSSPGWRCWPSPGSGSAPCTDAAGVALRERRCLVR